MHRDFCKWADLESVCVQECLRRSKDVSPEKKAQCVSLSCFLWGKMRTVAWETAPQRALRNCSKEVGEKDSMYVILVKGEYVLSSMFIFRRFLLVL